MRRAGATGLARLIARRGGLIPHLFNHDKLGGRALTLLQVKVGSFTILDLELRLERHALPVLARIQGDHVRNGNHQRMRDTTKTGLKSDEIIRHLHLTGRIRRQVQHDLAIACVTRRNAGVLIHQGREVRRESLIDTPFPDGAQQVRLGRYGAHGYSIRRCQAQGARHRGFHNQRRITFSEGVRASMKPCRLKMRSAYFMSGAAVLGSSMP